LAVACEDTAELKRLPRNALKRDRGKRDDVIAVFDARTGERQIELAGHEEPLISGMEDTTAVVWDVSAAYDVLKRPRD
jgi:hypothetical protein